MDRARALHRLGERVLGKWVCCKLAQLCGKSLSASCFGIFVIAFAASGL